MSLLQQPLSAEAAKAAALRRKDAAAAKAPLTLMVPGTTATATFGGESYISVSPKTVNEIGGNNKLVADETLVASLEDETPVLPTVSRPPPPCLHVAKQPSESGVQPSTHTFTKVFLFHFFFLHSLSFFFFWFLFLFEFVLPLVQLTLYALSARYSCHSPSIGWECTRRWSICFLVSGVAVHQMRPLLSFLKYFFHLLHCPSRIIY